MVKLRNQRSMAYLLERVLVMSTAERADQANPLVQQSVEAIAAAYGEPVRVTAKRIMDRVKVEQ